MSLLKGNLNGHMRVGLQHIYVGASTPSVPTTTTTGWVPTLQCSGGTKASMGLTVTGSSGTINWCGETWNLPADSGVTKEVCPTNHTIQPGEERWNYNTTSLQLTMALGSLGDRAVINLGSYIDYISNVRRRSTYATASTWTQSIYTPSTFRPLSALPFPTVSNYRLTDDFFTSYTQGGITYSWQRGTNW